MNKIYFSFLLTLFAGISTCIGYFVIYLKKSNHNKIIVSSLAFASGVMVCTSIIDLLPESIKLISNYFGLIGTITISFLSTILGIVLSMIIDYFVPENIIASNKKLFRIGILSMITIILHNIPEGIATFMAASNNISLGISLAIAIAMHNIPEGITISVPIYYSTGKKKIAFLYTLISALSEPFGALLAYIFLKDIINNFILGIILSLIAGIMLQISLRTLLPNTKIYNDNKRVIIYFIIGILFMLFGLLI